MSLDTPATIAIIGAGSVGIEAALYARFLGYDVQVFERGLVGADLLDDANEDHDSEDHRRPVGRCCSPLGLRALMAQDPNWSLPDLDTLWTPREFVENYLAPLSRTDLLDGHVVEQTEVTDVRRTENVEEDATEAVEKNDADDDLTQDNEDPQEDEDGDYIEEAPRLPPLRVTAQRVAPDIQPPVSFDADIVIDASGSTASGPDYRFISALRFERCPQTDRPLPSAAEMKAGAAAVLVLAEPNFYILGSKSRGREGGFEIVDGLRQIRDLFGLIGGRATLDLYQDLGLYRTQPDGGEP
ncbi:MAG: FAD-dependent oxidoreductase [Planctomycetes bacterium]|nr:FAD-dependent oxidoreductase [Planctomycetota bacterium]